MKRRSVIKMCAVLVFCTSITAFGGSGPDSSAVKIDGGGEFLMGANPMDGVPHYDWYYGCSPTSGAMLVGYWDKRAGYENLFYGDASVESSATREMIASAAHRVAGAENGYTYGDWQNSASYPNHESNPDCIADFMHTVNMGSYSENIASGLEAYIEWDNPNTPINESYQADVKLIDDSYWGGDLSYQILKDEIDADRPFMLNVVTFSASDDSWVGHSIVGYGYQDNMFTIAAADGSGNVVVPGIAVDDTWDNGVNFAQWLTDSDNNGAADTVVNPYIDSLGAEWWPLMGISLNGGYSYTSYMDWMVSDVITLNIAVPEPVTVLLLSTGFVFIRFKTAKRS